MTIRIAIRVTTIVILILTLMLFAATEMDFVYAAF